MTIRIQRINYEKRKTILIIDDNDDLLFILSDSLKDNYETICISDSTTVFKTLQEHDVDLVISDVMMPEIDGFKICELIKSNFELSHIPVLLLTAKNTLQSKIEGLDAGADVYIEKPFSMDFLLAQINSLLKNREKVKTHFAQSPTALITSIAYTKTDETFLAELEMHINDNITNPNLDVVLLAKCMNMSRTNLYRKINSISSLSPAEMINITRLKKAIELLSNRSVRINEVAYTVGYNSLTQLGRNFQKHFKMSPSEFVKKQIEFANRA
ncbi:response regulator transcription factor [Niabella ginsengisoli]|uniref:Response regulator n=1 Tax=Niabella ginsengisoli TaxID=522298 RepID=A0ABS9SL09_9BACT|nr:response regulator [Niabella ginsengisoli]MCH5599071.1 response regulator [Niabella ginsengisoli]